MGDVRQGVPDHNCYFLRLQVAKYIQGSIFRSTILSSLLRSYYLIPQHDHIETTEVIVKLSVLYYAVLLTGCDKHGRAE